MKKFLSLLLAIMMVLPLLIACSDTKNDNIESTTNREETTKNKDEETSQKGEETDKSEITTEEKYNAHTDLPEGLNFNNAEIQFISRNFSVFADELTIDRENDGDPIVDSIYRRNSKVEETLSVKLVNNKIISGAGFFDNFDVINKVKNEMSANTYSYDIMLSPSFACVFRTADGLWEDLTTIDNIDLSKEYWSSLYNDQVHVGNKQFFATGALSLSLKRMIYATFFNKKLAEKHNFENLYEVVRENRWTVDYQSEIIANTYQNLDGDDARTKDDFYGFVTNTSLSTDPYWTIWDIEILKRTEDDYFEYNLNVEQAGNYVGKIVNFYYDNPGVYIYEAVGEGDEQQDIRKHFSDGRAIMAQLKLVEIEEMDMRDMKDPYGILPLPKYEANDKPYYSSAFHAFTVFSILRGQSLSEQEMCGAVLEALSCESYNMVQPAYFEVALKGKYAKDPESWEMLDDMMKNLRVDEDFLYTSTDGVDILQKFRNAVWGKDKNFGEHLKRQEKLLKKTTEKLIEKIKKANGDM